MNRTLTLLVSAIVAAVVAAMLAFWLSQRQPAPAPVGDEVGGQQPSVDASSGLPDQAVSFGASASSFTPVDTSRLMALPYPYDLENAFPKVNFGNQRPLQVMPAPGDSENLFVLCQEGRVHVLRNSPDASETVTFLDIRDRVSRRGNEEGLLGLAFHHDYKVNGQFFVCYSAENDSRQSKLVVSRFRRSDVASLTADSASEEILLEVAQPFRTQNGGSIEFGPDGFLYIGLGDGGSANDPQEHGQNLKTLLGSVLRIDVDQQENGRLYAIPPDNPFVDRGEDARGEIWAYGFRNVWRLAFDDQTGELWCGDVGQNRAEEVNLVEKGKNYGWNKREARDPFDADDAFRFPRSDAQIAAGNAKYTEPVTMYYHSEGRAVIGGRVYRGSRLKALQGSYLYADFFSGFIWGLKRDGDKFKDRWVCNSTEQIAGFGEDANGEIYLCAFDGNIYRLARNKDYWEGTEQRFPYMLSETGLFESTEKLTPVEGVRSYSVNVPLWSDHAEKERLIALPENGRIEFSETGAWQLPVGAVVIKHFSMDMTQGDPTTRRRLETRLLVHGPRGWDGYTYIWNEEQKDAALMDMAVTERLEIQTPDGPVKRDWYYPSRSDCKACHTKAGTFVLSINTRQLNRQHDDGGSMVNQLDSWEQAGMFTEPLPRNPSALETYPDWDLARDEDIGELSRAYLDVNCAFCHAPGGPGNAPIDLRYHTPLQQTVLINISPRGTRSSGPPATALITPNRPGDSELVRRMEMRGPGQMPILATFESDEKALRIVSEWIRHMSPSR